MRFFPTYNKRLNLLLLLRSLRKGPVGLTCFGKSDGGGAQVHAVMSVQAFCHHFGFVYLHKPFSRIEHSSGFDEIDRWERTFGLGSGYGSAIETGLPIISLKEYSKKPWLWTRRVVVSLPHAHDFADLYPGCYRSNTNSSLGIEIETISDVAIHVRRGDVSSTVNSSRFTSNETILRRVNMLRKFLPKAKFRIYSEGDQDDFKIFSDAGCELSLGGDAVEALQQLSQAHLLVTAKSSFSYVAALLNPNLVLYERFCHIAQPGWVSIDDHEKIQRILQGRPF